MQKFPSQMLSRFLYAQLLLILNEISLVHSGRGFCPSSTISCWQNSPIPIFLSLKCRGLPYPASYSIRSSLDFSFFIFFLD